jgi:hypothetical protein
MNDINGADGLPAGISLEGLDYRQLAVVARACTERMQALREVAGPQLLERFRLEAQGLGLSIEEMVGAVKKPRGRRKKMQEE